MHMMVALSIHRCGAVTVEVGDIEIAFVSGSLLATNGFRSLRHVCESMLPLVCAH